MECQRWPEVRLRPSASSEEEKRSQSGSARGAACHLPPGLQAGGAHEAFSGHRSVRE